MAENNSINISFKYGEFKNLPTTISNGTIYVTTDDKTMYVDLNGQRLRLGDISIYKTIDDLTTDQKNWYKGALAYVSETNHLTYFTGTEWVVINDPNVNSKIENAIEGLEISYDSTSKRVILKDKDDSEVSSFDATAFIKDGVLDKAEYDSTTNTITLTWADTEKSTMDIDLSDLVDTYTGDNGITVATDGNISIDNTVVVTHEELD